MTHEVYKKLVASRQILEKSLVSSGGEGVLLTESRRILLNLQPLQLLQKLREGTVTAVAVLEAFQAKAIEESKRTNCVTLFIPNAKKLAQQLDTERASTDFKQRPLFGLPMSVKDMIMVEGTDSTLGLEKFVNKPADSDAALVDAYKKMGVIPFVKTNVPQLCLSFNCANGLYGETTNPHCTDRACGGSSGGEGSLIGGGASLFGLGTDIGGSVRIPANFCGIFSIKPTARRIPATGLVDPTPGLVGVFGTLGMLGRDAEIVAEATKCLLSLDLTEYNVDLPPVPWRECLYKGTIERPLKKILRIGWYDNLDVFPATPGVKRAIAESVDILKNLGHDVVEVKAPDGLHALKLWCDFAFADEGSNCAKLLEGEKIHDSYSWFKTISAVPARLREVAKPYIRHELGELYNEISCSIGTPTDMWKKLAERDKFFNDFTTSWKNQNLDLILCPVGPMPAPLKGFDSKLTITAIYTMIYNLIDLPCCVVPVTRETKEDQKLLETYPEEDNLLQLIKQNTKGSTGMPLGVQFVALPFCEEIICRIMTEFSKATNYKV